MRVPASISCKAPLAWRLLLLLVVVLLATVATPPAVEAGTFEKGVYTSNLGYRITPPEGWQAVDRGNHAVQTDAMPGTLAAAPASGYDVLFFDPTLEEPDEGAPEPIFDNIIVVVVPSAPAEVTDAAATALAEAMKPELTKLFPGSVTLTRATAAKHGSAQALDLEWQVEGADGAHKGVVVQSILPGEGQSVMVTCSIDAARADEAKKTCAAVLDSVKLN